MEVLNPYKASEADAISNWLLREYSFIMALPVTQNLNASYSEQCLPAASKMADVSAIPKIKPVRHPKKDL